MKRPSPHLFLLFPLAVLVGSCGDPVHDGEVTALGSEAPGVPQGEFHRAGQPCAVCHSPEGPASTVFSVAGTVFSGQNNTVGVDVASVVFVDDNGASSPLITTNCVGNFFVTPEEWNPSFPIRVALVKGAATAQMNGHISREASCANCHKDPPGLDSPGHVYLNTPADPNDPQCPVSPVAGGGP